MLRESRREYNMLANPPITITAPYQHANHRAEHRLSLSHSLLSYWLERVRRHTGLEARPLLQFSNAGREAPRRAP